MLQLTLSFRTNTAGSESQAGAGQSQPCKEPRLRSAGSFPSTPGRTHFQNDKQAKSCPWGAQQFQTWLDSKALLSKPDTCLQLLLTGHSLSDSTSFQGQCHCGHWSRQQQESSPSEGPGLLCPLPSELQQLNDPLQSCSNNQEFKQKPEREAGATLPLSGLLQHTTELKCCQGPAYTVLKYLKNEISQSCGVRAGRNKWFLSPCSGLNKKPPEPGPQHLRASKGNKEKERQTVMEPATISGWTALGEAQFWWLIPHTRCTATLKTRTLCCSKDGVSGNWSMGGV